jgi:23S rRNA (guanosine2251-2'-O)-methyltransferase
MNKKDYGSRAGRPRGKAAAGSAGRAGGKDKASGWRNAVGTRGTGGSSRRKSGGVFGEDGSYFGKGVRKGKYEPYDDEDLRREGSSYKGRGARSAKAVPGKTVKADARELAKRERKVERPARSSSSRGMKKAYAPEDKARWNDAPEAKEREDRIEGRNPVLEVLRSERPINKIFIEKNSADPSLMRIAAMARDKGIPVQYVERRKLDAMSSARIHQGVILEAAQREYAEVSDILRIAAERDEEPFIVILDGITDPNNFGSIIRSAECAGAHGIVIPKRRSATLNATVAKVAAGAQEHVAIARVGSLTQAIRELKNNGVWITAADPDGDKPYYESDLNGPVALVIGSEGEGISRVVRDECDYLVRIPMRGSISSLNAGVAAALIMFEISRRRG